MDTSSTPPTHDLDRTAGQDAYADPSDWTALIEQAFFDRLHQVLTPDAASFQPEGAECQVRQRLTVLDEQLRHLVHNAMDTANIRFTILAVAAFDVLEPPYGLSRRSLSSTTASTARSANASSPEPRACSTKPPTPSRR